MPPFMMVPNGMYMYPNVPVVPNGNPHLMQIMQQQNCMPQPVVLNHMKAPKNPPITCKTESKTEACNTAIFDSPNTPDSQLGSRTLTMPFDYYSPLDDHECESVFDKA